MNPQTLSRRAALWAAAAAILALAGNPAVAIAKAPPVSGKSEQVSLSVTVMAVDAAGRHLMVRDPNGEVHSFKVGPQVRGFDQVRPGDKIAAHIFRETAYVVSNPGEPLPKDTDKLVAARAAKGEWPAAVVANHIVVSGAVLAIDPAAARLKVVSPQGGEVHEVDVVTPEGRQFMAKLKVGDKVTIYVTEAVVVSLEKS